MAVEGSGRGDRGERRVIIGPARRTADVVFSLAASTVMFGGGGGLAWRTSALVHHASAAIYAVLGGLWLGLLLLAFVLSVQIVWRIFGREEIAVRDAVLSVEARLLGGRVSGQVTADRRLVARLDEIPTRARKLVYPKFHLVFVHGQHAVATTSTLTREEGEAALVMVRRILPT